MIIHQDRQKLTGLIHSYMDEKITAFQLDDELWKLRASQDKTVEWVAEELWCFYDDCVDHKIHASKEVWDFFWRSLLLLESNAEILETNTKNIWHWQTSQFLSLIFLCLFGWIVYYTGWGSHLLVVVLPFGAIGILLYKRTRIKSNINFRTYPFSSFTEIRSIRKNLASFSKISYPGHLKTRRIRSQFSGTITSIPAYLLGMFIGPLILLLASLPQKQTQISIQLSA